MRDPADPFAIKADFDRLVGWSRPAPLVAAWLRAGLAARRTWLRLPFESGEVSADGVLPPAAPLTGSPLEGRSVGLALSGGSGNMVCGVGALRAIEEAGGHVTSVSGCSGGALWAALVALGWDADRVLRFSLGELDPRRYLDPGVFGPVLRAVWKREAWAGAVSGKSVQTFFDDVSGGARLGDLPLAFHTVLWQLESNRVVVVGSSTTPDWTLGEAVRASLSLAPVVEPFVRDGLSYLDGGVINVFPASTVLLGPPCDAVVGVNGFLPVGLQGPDLTGWRRKPDALLRVARQLQLAPFHDIARREWQAIDVPKWLVEPIEPSDAYGIAFFAAMVDRRAWPARIRSGHEATRAALGGVA